ncbi:MAG: class I SAM-dependent methyltransferase [Desulfobacterium sp.]|nr:class I SAM-dependent methyltransferase [Desulfobacterium sp.]
MSNFNSYIDPHSNEKLLPSNQNELITVSDSKSFPIINNIPRFVSKEFYEQENQNPHSLKDKESQTASSFGNKWQDKTFANDGVNNEFARNRLLEQFLAMLGLQSESDLINLLGRSTKTLNGGCGVAWSEYLFNPNLNCERHCIDISLAVEAAYKNTKHLPNVTISQASILEIPYPEEFFDIVYSAGVVHHTPNPKKATQELGKRVKKGGILGIYIYNKKPFLREMTDHKLRDITTKMSFEECLDFSNKISLLGKSLQNLTDKDLIIEKDIPLLDIKAGTYKIQQFFYDHFIKCWYNENLPIEYSDLCNLDWYHPEYASHHDKDEVVSWFKEIGFNNIQCIQPSGWEYSGCFISGKRTDVTPKD